MSEQESRGQALVYPVKALEMEQSPTTQQLVVAVRQRQRLVDNAKEAAQRRTRPKPSLWIPRQVYRSTTAQGVLQHNQKATTEALRRVELPAPTGSPEGWMRRRSPLGMGLTCPRALRTGHGLALGVGRIALVERVSSGTSMGNSWTMQRAKQLPMLRVHFHQRRADPRGGAARHLKATA